MILKIRCLLRLNEVNISESESNQLKSELIEESLRYISKVLQLCSKWFNNEAEQNEYIQKELEWMIQSSWNQAVDAENCSLEPSSCLLFEQTAQLINLSYKTEYLENLYQCYYFSIKYRIKESRENKQSLSESVPIAKKSFDSLWNLIPLLKDKLDPIVLDDLKSFLILSNFEMELLNQNWENISKILDSPELPTYRLSLLKSMAGNQV